MGAKIQLGRVEGAVPSTLSIISASINGVMNPMMTISTVETIAPIKLPMFSRISAHMAATGFCFFINDFLSPHMHKKAPDAAAATDASVIYLCRHTQRCSCLRTGRVANTD